MVLKFAFTTYVLLVINLYSFAQIIKVDKDWIAKDSTNKWQGVIDVSIINLKNTQTIFQMASSVQVSYSWSKSTILSASNIRLLFADSQPLENAGFQHFRYINDLNSNISFEGFTQVQFDQLLKIKLRWITGGGVRLTLLNKERAKLYIRPGYMYEYEQEGFTSIINRHNRMSNYITLRMKGKDNGKFYFTLFYQPRFDDFSDYRISPAWTIEFTILKKMILLISGDLGYDSRPVEGVSKSTYIFTQGLGLRF